MGSQFVEMAPGISAIRRASPRSVFLQRSERWLAQGRLIDGAKARDVGNTPVTNLRAGLVIGRLTSGGKYGAFLIGTVQSAYTSGGTSLTLDLAGAAELLRRIGATGTATAYVIGPPTAAGTVAKTAMTWSAIDTATGIVTITSLGVNKVAGSWVVAADGTDAPNTFVGDNQHMHGINVVDGSGASISSVSLPELPVEGIVDASQLIPWPSDTAMQDWLEQQLSTAMAGKFVFDNKY